MNLKEVMEEAANVIKGITGLKMVFDYPPPTMTPPAGYISYPRSVDYDQTYVRGEDQFTDFPIVLVASKVTDRSTRDTVAAWASGSGDRSIKAAFEARNNANAWQSCDEINITTCEFDVEVIAGVQYLAAMFKATVVGPGEEQ